MEYTVTNHMLPFFWQHGEDEATLRHYMQVIEEANCRAVCVESRPHPDFCGPGWWRDMDIILDEARKRKMKVWILDDSHFPTGYCNGAVKKAPDRLRRASIVYQHFTVKGGTTIKKSVKSLTRQPLSFGRVLTDLSGKNYEAANRFSDDRVLSAVAVNESGERFDLIPQVQNSSLKWTAPAGAWTVRTVSFTHNAGVHRSYMNMMDPESCRILIDTVCEAHYRHYAADFGKTIAGFFSDEPELGNGELYHYENLLGTPQDLPWSEPLDALLKERLGSDAYDQLYLLWENDAPDAEKARVRSIYMDCVSRLVQHSFSEQIGDWCRAHGVAYIGHLIEDNNQHARTGSSLGHFFRAQAGQHMAGVDTVGGQHSPMGEDSANEVKLFGIKTDGEFCHFALAKLAGSGAAIDPQKQGRAMCELFGAYGWKEGVRQEKYILDHFLSRGVNTFVPHAFSPKKYPDPDCPPHFYAGGHNPQYRHFAKLMAYGNRVASLIDGGRSDTQVAVLYHAEAEWAGKYMLMQKPARALAERQIDFHFLPADVFSEPERYQTSLENGFTVNGNRYRALVVPYAQFIPSALASHLEALLDAGCRVLFIDALPEGVATGEALPAALLRCETVTLRKLADSIGSEEWLTPQSPYLRLYHYIGQKEILLLNNEQDKPYRGTLHLPASYGADWFLYDPWEDRDCEAAVTEGEDDVQIKLSIKALDTCVLVKGRSDEAKPSADLAGYEKTVLSSFTQSVCRAIDYPKFTGMKTLCPVVSYDKQDPKFSGFIRYECRIGDEAEILEIESASEGVELFLNGTSLGIQVTAPFRYGLGGHLKAGENELRIEVATTLERERGARRGAAPTGLTGEVRLWKKERKQKENSI